MGYVRGAVMGFWDLRWAAYRNVRRNARVRSLVAWDVARAIAGGAGFFTGLCAHAPMIADSSAGRPFIGALCTFATFLASFVLAVMANTGKREMDLVRDAATARLMQERLTWLLSDQLLMVVSALATAATGLVWLGCDAIGFQAAVLTAATIGFGGTALVSALRLPLQIWELQSTSIDESRERAISRLNRETDERFKDDR